MPPKGTKKRSVPSYETDSDFEPEVPAKSQPRAQIPPMVKAPRKPRHNFKRKRTFNDDGQSEAEDSTPVTSLKDEIQRGKTLAQQLLADLRFMVSAPETDRWYNKAKEVETVFHDLEKSATTGIATETQKDTPNDIQNMVKRETDRVIDEIKAGTLVTGDAGDLIKTHLRPGDGALKNRIMNETTRLSRIEVEEIVKKQVRVALTSVVEKSVEEERKKFERFEKGWKNAKGQLFGEEMVDGLKKE